MNGSNPYEHLIPTGDSGGGTGDDTKPNPYEHLIPKKKTEPAKQEEPGWLSGPLGEPTKLKDLGSDPVQRAIVDLVVDPVRSIGSDIYGLATSRGGTDRDKFWQQREKGLKTTDILAPKSATTETIENIIGFPGAVIGTAIPAASEMLLGHRRTAEAGPYAQTLADAVPFLAPAGAAYTRAVRPRSVETSAIAARDAARLMNRIRDRVSSRFRGGLYEGGPSALDAAEQIQAGRREGQDYTLLDVNNPVTKALAGTTYREGGAGGGIIRDFLRRRHEGQVGRAEAKIGEIMGDPSTFTQTAKQLSETRSTSARPVWKEAEGGAGLKALETEFTKANAEAGARINAAQQALNDANNRLTQLQGRRATVPRDTFGKSSEERLAQTAERTNEMREAQAAVDKARATIEYETNYKAGIEQLMRTARQDGTLRPDAVWSPNLELLRENPNISGGIARGWAIERDRAHARFERPNPIEYAIKGFDNNGDPIVGAVPNMKLWMVAKEGLDADIQDSIKANNGHVIKATHAKIELRDSLVGELDRLNPKYKAARDQWGGDTASMNALQDGRHMLKTGENARFDTDADLADYLTKLSESDREFMKLGLAQDILEKVRNAPRAADTSKRMVNTPAQETRIRMLLGPDADRFIQAVDREAEMERSYTEIAKGSQTRQREVEDKTEQGLRRAESLGQGVISLWRALTHLNPVEGLRGVGHLYRGVRGKTMPDMAVNEGVARIMTDPDVQISTQPGGPILPPIRVPRAYMWTPGRVLATGEGAAPRDPATESLRRAFGMQ